MAITYSYALAKIEKESKEAGDLFATIFEYAQDSVIELSDKIPALKGDEEMASQITRSMIACYLTGSVHGVCIKEEYKRDVYSQMEVIGRNLGLIEK
jgi:hypothetical protein